MSGWFRYLKLQAEARTGLNNTVIAWAILAVVCGAVTFVFLILSIGIWLAEHYGPLAAALALGAFFLLVTMVALVACVIGHRRSIRRASQALAMHGNAPWVHPKTLVVGMQIGRAIGWRRLVPLIAVGVIAAGLTKEWFGNDKATRDDESADRDERNAA